MSTLSQHGHFLHRRDEPIAPPRQSFNEAWTVGRIPQHFTQAHHRVVQSVVKVDKRISGPQTFAKLIPGDHISRFFQQDDEDLEGLFREFDPKTVFAQLKCFEVNLKNATPYKSG